MIRRRFWVLLIAAAVVSTASIVPGLRREQQPVSAKAQQVLGA